MAAIVGHRFQLSPTFLACIEFRPGFTYTRLEWQTQLQVGDQQSESNQRFRSLQLAIEPQFSVQKRVGPIGFQLRAGYHLQVSSGKLLAGAGSLTYLRIGETPVHANWTGLRAGIGIQYTLQKTQRRRDSTSTGVSFALGLGQDYGGLGGNLLVYPQRNIGMFVGAGYALAGLGYNLGVKLRTTRVMKNVRPFFIAMYGYNAAVLLPEQRDANQLFYGSTFGIGVDTSFSRDNPGYWSFSLNVPLRDSSVKSYFDFLEQQGFDMSVLLPLSFSVGYRFLQQ